ncbi:uncharacterized protein I206_101401 [Kwoniella pini CBS 10737]|uniref:Uncharacterized protein n=1 Tax=Kwoniella pini CBS 10737 TaxID=1296096 RepID=A0A1B9HWS4_9TREE|nr:uncharacterized protein I206_06629 [Kwoniella pini CBS 10737]OCF47723.1 hypothetical protein I206_06629 [Kwoniella pini CBS 10737]
MSTHPFLVDQTPSLPIASSSKSTIYTSPKSSIYTCSAMQHTHTRTNSSTSINTLASDISTSSNTSTSSFSSVTSSYSRSAPIDRECLRWMQQESDCEHLFGSVSSRGKSLSLEEREVRRRAMEVGESQSSLDQSEKSRLKDIKAERRKGKVGKWF